jgi:Tetratricopeptide repeat
MSKTIAVFIFLFAYIVSVKAQNTEHDEWLRLLNDDGEQQALNSMKVQTELGKYDTLAIIGKLKKLEASVGTSKRLKARVLALKSRLLFYRLGPGDSLYASYMKTAVDLAYELDDYYMIGEFSRWYGEMLNSTGKIAMAAQYCMNSMKIQDELGVEHFPTYQRFYLTTAEMLFRTRNYNQAIPYYRKAFSLKNEDETDVDSIYYANSLNTLGRCYYFEKKFDSSLYYYEKCMTYIRKKGVAEDWYYMASDNRFDPYLKMKQYDSCRVIADNLYQAGLPDDSLVLMSGCFLKAQIAISQENYAEGLKWAQQAEKFKQGTKLETVLFLKDLALCYEKLGQTDKALAYYKLHKEKEAEARFKTDKANAAYLEAESDFQKSLAKQELLKKQRDMERLKRKLFISGISLVSLTALYLLNKRRKRSEKEKKVFEKESHFFQQEYKSADELMKAFKNEVLEKSRLIEELLANKEEKSEQLLQVDKVAELSRQVLLTEKDWQKFKSTFDTLYPNFFTGLKISCPGITIGELRMASLSKLNFDNKHIASMLGISLESVHKTRYRLRKKMGGNENIPLDDIIASI